MKKIILFMILVAFATISNATTWEIKPSGNDTTGNGTLATPWRSLYKACTTVTTSGDIIHIGVGTYLELRACPLSVGVSILGDGATSIIKSHFVAPNRIYGYTVATIYLVSTTEGANGNQTLSNFTLDGDGLIGNFAMLIKRRGNVILHDLTVRDFYMAGITFIANSDPSLEPTTYSSNSQLYNCTMSNCGDTDATWDGGGLIQSSGQADMLIHDNNLSQIGRALGHNGNIMNFGRYNKGTKYYNNVSTKFDSDAGAWSFHIEGWNNVGGVEIYNNTFNGGDIVLDIAGYLSSKGEYEYSYSVHDNLFQPRLEGQGKTYAKKGVLIESYDARDVLIYNNTFKDGYWGVSIYPRYCNNIQIYDNIFSNGLFPLSIHSNADAVYNITDIHFFRNSGSLSKDGATTYEDAAISIVARETSNVSDVFIYNNTFSTDNLVKMVGVKVQTGNTSGTTPISGGTMSNINIKNNILTYFTNVGQFWVLNNGAINGLHLENNLAYNTSNSNVLPVFWAYNIGTLSNYTYLNNIPISNTTQQNPLFVSITDYRLQTESPARNTGVNVGLPYLETAPDIGAFEYSVPLPAVLSSEVKENGKTVYENGKVVKN